MTGPHAGGQDEDLPVLPARYTGRWVAAAVVVGAAVLLAYSMFTNERFQWDVVGQYLLAPPVLAGLGKTLMLTAVSMAIGIVLGIVVAVCRLSANPILLGAPGPTPGSSAAPR